MYIAMHVALMALSTPVKALITRSLLLFSNRLQIAMYKHTTTFWQAQVHKHKFVIVHKCTYISYKR